MGRWGGGDSGGWEVGRWRWGGGGGGKVGRWGCGEVGRWGGGGGGGGGEVVEVVTAFMSLQSACSDNRHPADHCPCGWGQAPIECHY